MIHAPTGLGKTLAAWLQPVSDWLTEHSDTTAWPKKTEPLRVLWLTPLRALAHDTVLNLRAPIDELGLPWEIDLRTGDTSSTRKAKQRLRLPTALVTTPESLSLLLSHPETEAQFAQLRWVVVDEWHELLGSKRGVQTELALARLRRWCPQLRTWGLSATLGNLDEALDALLGDHAGPRRLIPGDAPKAVEVTTVLPSDMERFPWAGHLGLKLLPEVIERIAAAKTTLLFTNTRSQTELWFRALLEAKPEWAADLGIHHGSLNRDEREAVEHRLREGTIRAVVCTSSLDLGVDFSPVEQVIQIGGPKGVARLLQRAGRSGHQPGAISRVVCVPTQALELVEYAAARDAMAADQLEPRIPLRLPLDVLVQHVVTLALAGATQAEVLAEARSTHAFRELTDEAFGWVLSFVTQGGKSLRAYPEYCRVTADADGRLGVSSPLVARLHRMSIGTITSDGAVAVKFLNGASLGTVEESFIGRLKPKSRFVFAGRFLELIRVHQTTAWVRAAKKPEGAVPVWEGGRSPLSSQLAAAVRRQFDAARHGRFPSAELGHARGVLELQAAWSILPAPDELLVETTESREGRHWFVYSFGGRLTHEGLGALVAFRLSRRTPITATVAVNDYGFELLPVQRLELTEDDWRAVLSPENLLSDLLACVNGTELARRQFREIARVAGLVFPGFPGAGKTGRQLQASSSLFFEVFSQYEPDHLLLEQARREVLEQQLEFKRLQTLLESIQRSRIVLRRTERLTPFAFPLWAESLRGQVSSESWTDRVQRMARELEEAADLPLPEGRAFRPRSKESGTASGTHDAARGHRSVGNRNRAR